LLSQDIPAGEAQEATSAVAFCSGGGSPWLGGDAAAKSREIWAVSANRRRRRWLSVVTTKVPVVDMS
jgi:hypothetical protein